MEKPSPGACALCGSSRDEVCPCLGCETPYHEACVVERGCAHPDCALQGVPGRFVLPRDRVFGAVALVLWIAVAASYLGVHVERAGGDIRTWSPMNKVLMAALAAACLATVAAYVRDRMTPPGRVLHRELVGRALVFGAGFLWVGAAFERGSTCGLAGLAAFLAGVVAMALRPNRRTHHPLRRRSALPEMVVNLFIAWFVFAAIVWYAIFGDRSYRRERANTRACYANQKTLVGAMEMYNLDRRAQQEFAPAHFQALRSGGYLQAIPQDPGQGAGTSGHYRGTKSGNGLTCTVHGAIQ